MIGIFDSGVGGLGIYKEVKKLIPNESILYLADSVNCPYGEKTDSFIKKVALKNTKFLISKGCNIIVIACNTASTIALEYVRQTLTKSQPTRLTLVRVVGVVPVVKTAAKVSKNKRIGILATKKTVESKYLQNLVNRFCPKEKWFKIYYQEANELVTFVENFHFSYLLSSSRKRSASTSGIHLDSRFHGNDTIKKYLQSFIKANVDVVALGCTHFPFLRAEIEEIMGSKVAVLDSNGAVGRQVARIVNSISLIAYSKSHIAYSSNKNHKRYAISDKPIYQFYTSGNPAKTKPVIEKLLDEKIDHVLKKR